MWWVNCLDYVKMKITLTSHVMKYIYKNHSNILKY